MLMSVLFLVVPDWLWVVLGKVLLEEKKISNRWTDSKDVKGYRKSYISLVGGLEVLPQEIYKI